MKKNFLVTTGLVDSWEFEEKNFPLGKWCEFYELNDFDDEKFNEKILMKNNVIGNKYHWDNHEKKFKDYEYLNKKVEYLLKVISEKLSNIHNVSENKEYWKTIIFHWLNSYTSTIFDRWENIRTFFEKNNTEKFYSNFISLNYLDYIPKDYTSFVNNSQKHEWNHMIYLRIFNFLNIQNLSLIEKKIRINYLEKKVVTSDTIKELNSSKKPSLVTRVIHMIDNVISKFAFSFNKIIIESFYFPKKEYLKICLRCKLIPTKYPNLFNFDIKENILPNNDKRTLLKNLLLRANGKDNFDKFLLQNLHKDIPMSYLENFDSIKRKLLPYSRQKKIIFSMHSLATNDNFKIYIAETKKVGSKFTIAEHGGGITLKFNPMSDFFKKASDKMITWGNTIQNKVRTNLSPTLPIIKSKKSKIGNDCIIIFSEGVKYTVKSFSGPELNESFNLFNEIVQFVNKLNPEIKSKIKFRSKGNFSFNSEKKFSEMFGKKSIVQHSIENSFDKAILNCKLIIATYPQTSFSESMYFNTPTILINKDFWQFSKTGFDTFNDLKENKIAFKDIYEAKNHINKHWSDLDLWWKSEKVQLARKRFLKNFFNVKPNWYREWSDYIYFSLSS